MKLSMSTLGCLGMLVSSQAWCSELSTAKLQVIQTIVKAADHAEVPRELLLAVCWVESSYRTKLQPRLDGSSHSYGICQIKLETAKHMDSMYKHRISATAKRLSDPYINAFYAAKYLKFQLERYHGNWQKAVDAYNKGRCVSPKSQYVHKVMIALTNVYK